MSSYIKRLSGPVSCSLVQPNIQYNYLPTLLLFGDVHFSTANECMITDNDNDAIEIYKPEFFKLFSDLYNDRSVDNSFTPEAYPIDIYSEDW